MGGFYGHQEPTKIGSIVCIGTGEICHMDLFHTLIDRTFVLELDEEWYFDAANKLTDDNSGVFLQDCFNDKGYNCEAVILKFEATDKWSRQYEVRAMKPIKNQEELFIEYGKEYWCYKPHFISLSEDQRAMCIEHYEIDDENDLIEIVLAEAISPVNRGGKNAPDKGGNATAESPSNKRVRRK